jgi:hypothetical protein
MMQHFFKNFFYPHFISNLFFRFSQQGGPMGEKIKDEVLLKKIKQTTLEYATVTYQF